MPEFFRSGPDLGPLLVLAHGAGAPATSPFMALVAELLADRGVASARFEFGYMAQRRNGGKRKPPPRADRLIAEYNDAVAELRANEPVRKLFIGGKSMGGRVASMAAEELHRSGCIAGLVCLGYPFHPPGKSERTRTEHLASLSCPTLIVQGERDPFGTRNDVETYSLSNAIRFHWAGDGDHDLGPRGGSGFTRRGNLEAACDAIAQFLRGSR